MTRSYRYLTLTVIVLLVASCAKREGVIDKKNRIEEVYAEERHYMDNNLFHSIESYVEEDWHWDGKEMYRIDYRGEHPYSENFFYGSHRCLERTTVPAYNIRSEFFYDGRMLEHIDYYRDDEKYLTVTLLHDGENLTEIDCQYYSLSTESDSEAVAILHKRNPIAALLGAEVHSKLEAENTKRLAAQCKSGKGPMLTRYELTWDGDNVSAIRCIDADGTRNILLSYDDKRNPYRQLFGYREITDPLFGFEMLSENNITSIRMPYGRNANQLFTYRYEYDGDYPSKRTLTYSYQTISVFSFDSVMYKYEKEERYVYED